MGDGLIDYQATGAARNVAQTLSEALVIIHTNQGLYE